MKKAVAILAVILEILKLGAQYLPRVIEQFSRAVGIATGQVKVTPELEARIEADSKELDELLADALAAREREAAELAAAQNGEGV
jgi:hypothetical protein